MAIHTTTASRGMPWLPVRPRRPGDAGRSDRERPIDLRQDEEAAAMAKKWVRRMSDVRRLRSESRESGDTRRSVAREVLAWIAENASRARLYQQQGIEVADGRWRVADFFVAFPDGYTQAIEVGNLGTERRRELERAVDDVVQARRGVAFRYHGPRPTAKSRRR
jgi:hypothetical protein